jgi:hypothetical protein
VHVLYGFGHRLVGAAQDLAAKKKNDKSAGALGATE